MLGGLPHQVLPSGAGVRRPPLFFLQGLMAWNAKKSGKVGAGSQGAARKPSGAGGRDTPIHATSAAAAAADAVTVQVQIFPSRQCT
jgi:hypothetical protein